MELGIILGLCGLLLYLDSRAFKRIYELEKNVFDTQVRFNDRIAELENKVFLLNQSPSNASGE